MAQVARSLTPKVWRVSNELNANSVTCSSLEINLTRLFLEFVQSVQLDRQTKTTFVPSISSPVPFDCLDSLKFEFRSHKLSLNRAKNKQQGVEYEFVVAMKTLSAA